ncbi:hypothetical protein INR49_011297, partial [Caranx melampygus]
MERVKKETGEQLDQKTKGVSFGPAGVCQFHRLKLPKPTQLHHYLHSLLISSMNSL